MRGARAGSEPIRFGIRLQLIFALLGLLALAFLPLFAAIAELTKASLRDARETSARSLGRAVAARVAEATARRVPEDLRALLDAQLGSGGVAAIGIYDQAGRALSRAGDADALDALPNVLDARLERVRTVRLGHMPAVEIVVPGPRGAIATILRTSDDSGQTAPLLRLVALYTAVVALALLIFAYIALGRLIVQPLDALSAAARRVAHGARNLDVPRSGPAELMDLGRSLLEMTNKLVADEIKVREQIEELELRAQELRLAQDQLVRSERLASVGKLAAGLAHEIGNPIAAILGLHDILLEGGLDPDEQRDFLLRTRSEAERIHVILRDLLDFARPGAIDAEHDAAGLGDVGEAIVDAVSLIKPQKSFQDIRLDVDLAPGPLVVALAQERLMQVVLNLLLNAVDATSSRIRITAAHLGATVRFSVEDDGPGIPPAIQARLFEPFVTTKDIGKGTGLGLAVCRGVVESAGGSIDYDETFSDGARFVVEIPASAVSDAGGYASPVPRAMGTR